MCNGCDIGYFILLIFCIVAIDASNDDLGSIIFVFIWLIFLSIMQYIEMRKDIRKYRGI